jgi:hypothetical protein
MRVAVASDPGSVSIALTGYVTCFVLGVRVEKRAGTRVSTAHAPQNFCMSISNTSTVTEAMNVLQTKLMFLKWVKRCLAVPN